MFEKIVRTVLVSARPIYLYPVSYTHLDVYKRQSLMGKE